MFQKWILLFLVVLSPLFSQESYYLCIDGGGSKTRITLLDQKGIPQQISYRGVVGEEVYFAPSNILQIGKENMQRLIGEIFGEILLTAEGKSLKEYVKEIQVVGGFAGVPRELERQIVEELFFAQGCKKETLTVKCDGVLSSEVAGVGGISLIAGTGSVCMSSEGGKSIKAGGARAAHRRQWQRLLDRDECNSRLSRRSPWLWGKNGFDRDAHQTLFARQLFRFDSADPYAPLSCRDCPSDRRCICGSV